MGKRLSILPIIEKSLCREHKNVNTRTVENRKSVDERFEIWPGNLVAADVRHGDKQEGRHFLRRFEHRIPNCTPRRHGPPLRSRCC